MNLNAILTSAGWVIALCASPLAFAGGNHDHDHAKEEHHHDENVTKGPNGGHEIESKAGFAFEVTVGKDRRARILFLDKSLKPTALAQQVVGGIAGERSAPVKLAFAAGKDADAGFLISDKPLPAGDHVPMILTIRLSPDAKPVTERFELHLH